MSDYTPTTEEVRQAYAAYMSSIQNPDWSFEPEFRSNQDRFNRWLAAHDAEVAEKAREQAVRSVNALPVDRGETRTAEPRVSLGRVLTILRETGR